ncbi:MAG: helix-turn-helix transcriptional regulator [Bacteroidales bacterium]|jgi:DNA-binding XRE family transcriptional regulator|nr:helix-turn-helix transcriptional regulator [Bacteroidales bacterium]
MKDRIFAIIQEEEMTNAKFAQEIGVQSSSISHITSGRNNPSIDLITKILNRFPGISADWLLQGKGKMYKYQNEEQVVQASAKPPEQDLFSSFKNPVAKPASIQEPSANATESLSEPSNRLSDESPAQYGANPQKRVEKVIILYSDKSFTEYRPD